MLTSTSPVPRWGVFELALRGPEVGNPFVDVWLTAIFRYRNRKVRVEGFYDGNGVYRVRCMPDELGDWRYEVHSNVAELDDVRGEFRCVQAGSCEPDAQGSARHGPVRAVGSGFAHADGTRYLPFGTTCYHWTHRMDRTAEQATLRSLANSPYNKVRMCLLPTAGMRPPRMAFAVDTDGRLDKTRFDPAFFRHQERRIADLRALGIEADVILFHPYDKGHWGVDNMTPEEDARYVRYVVARLAAYSNVWWSISNEFDFNQAKSVDDWDQLSVLVQRCDPYQRLRSIHNGTKMYEYCEPYDFTKPWITHQSIQHWNADSVPAWLERCEKPVIIDEIGYEGDIGRRWGNLGGAELVDRIWQGVATGGFVAHGECFRDRPFGPWISVGGELYGESTSRIAFLRRLLEQGGQLRYFGGRQPSYAELRLPSERDHRIDLIDAWQMRVTELEGMFSGECRIPLPSRPYQALRIVEVADE